jgi:predicted glycosyltransferase
MKIWFDLSNSPHINMFVALIRDLEREHEHEVVITCRPLANTVALLELHGLPHAVVGAHYGASLRAKLLGFPVRVAQLLKFLRRQRIDVAVSQSSFHSPVVARLLGVRSIYMNDNEHAIGNIPAFACASKIMVPEALSIEKLKKQWANPKKVVHYPGVKEGLYLWELDARRRNASGCGLAAKARKVVYIRPEPWTAQYYKGRRNFLDDLVLGLKEQVDIVILPRGAEQGVHYRQPRFDGVQVIDTALDVADIAPDCDLFIGAGGTMTREMAVLGVPTLSVYQDELLDVDRYLIAAGAYLHRPDLTASEALRFLAAAMRRPPDGDLLAKGRVAYHMLRDAIVHG